MINDSLNRFLGVLCYPLLSMDIFREELFEEYINAVKEHRDAKEERERIRDKIRTKALAAVQREYSLYSYDEIYLYLEKCFLYDAEQFESAAQLYRYLMKKMAAALISRRDGKIVFKYWENQEDRELFGGFGGNNKVHLFHSLNCHIPLDVIAIVYLILHQEREDASCLEDFYGNIEVADKQLAYILEKGVAENHLHKGVSRTFSSTWNSMMEPLVAQKIQAFRGKQLFNGTKEQNRHMLFYILGCGIVRGWMIYEYTSEEPGKWEEPEEQEELKKLVKRFREGQPFEDYYQERFCGKQEEQDREAEGEILAYYAELWTALERSFPERSLCRRFCRIAFREEWLPTFDENIFLYHILTRFFSGEMRKEDEKCVMQYLRVRNYYFHLCVQQKTIKGLDYFQQVHYNINSVLNHLDNDDFWENAIREQLQNRNLQKIEFRTSMPVKKSEFKKEVLAFLKAYRNVLRTEFCCFDGRHYVPKRKLPQVGLVLHFLKREDENARSTCIHNAQTDCRYYQFGSLQKEYEQQVENLIELRSEFSELSRYLVAIDAASLENVTPVWVFAPIYRKARGSFAETAGRVERGGDYMQSLGFTFHAGEDFRHILSGLRRMDEVVEHLKFHAGDRIGHGSALGIAPGVWKSRNPIVILPRIEALDNYLWAYDTMSAAAEEVYVPSAGFKTFALAYIEKRIFELAEAIYTEMTGFTLQMLLKSYRNLFSDWDIADRNAVNRNAVNQDAVNRNAVNRDMANRDGNAEGVSAEQGSDCRFCRLLQVGASYDKEGKEGRECSVELLSAARHCGVFVKRMEQPIHHEITEQDILIAEELQRILRKKLSKKGIVIEINPSSNLSIAEQDLIGENQFYQLNEPDIAKGENLITCINSDDPSVFNTNAPNELAYIYYGMLERKISREAALAWIDRIRSNGMASSFIANRESDEMLLEKLDELIERF